MGNLLITQPYFISLIHKGVQYNATDEIAFFKNKKKQKKSKDILTCD